MTPPKNCITPDQFVSFDDLQNLPYLKEIGLVKYLPKHFGLEKWTRLFVIPDYWMRRIYRNDVYASKNPSKEVGEKMTLDQRKLLYDWLTKHSPVLQGPNIDDQRSPRNELSYEDILDLLDVPQVLNESRCDSEATITLDDDEHEVESKIPICRGHKIQPEHVIFQQAIDRMNNLDPEEQTRFERLIADKEFMDLLQASIGCFLSREVATTSAQASAKEKRA